MLNRDGNGRVTRDLFVSVVPSLYEVDFMPTDAMMPKKAAPAGAAARLRATSDGDPATLFRRVRKIGKGSYGLVYQAIDTRTNQEVALKVLDCEGNDDSVEDVHKYPFFVH